MTHTYLQASARKQRKQLSVHTGEAFCSKCNALVLQVSGMTCSACCAAVEAELDALPGVANAVVSLIQQQARVDYDTSIITTVRCQLLEIHHVDSGSDTSQEVS
jgi:copper chaperone CopZ